MEQFDIDHRLLDKFAYALLDPLRGDEASRSAWRTFPLYELAPAGFAAQAAQLPTLVDLRNIHPDTRKHLIHLLLNQSPPIGAELCVALLQTSADRARVVMHLRNMIAPRFPQGRRGIFRFHDPDVFEHLVWMLSAPTLAGLFGPIATWAVPLHGGWLSQETESKLARHAPASTLIPPLGCALAELGLSMPSCIASPYGALILLNGGRGRKRYWFAPNSIS